ncbi:zinc finger protein ZFAT [Trichonephila clavata]|uniref:Zinc finger protein ZFAT n=1 Tax=Trichonephila clavata TaxID=2740835 RepID=A0A8X6KGR3_TRICU|nr:zinc finger protein ZFAT [Trichonephila clavata]
MLESTKTKPFTSIEAGNDNEKTLSNLVTFLNESKFLFQDVVDSTPDNEIMVQNSSSSDTFQTRKSIYVCTFCQVFSSSDSAITAHIATVHGTSLPSGTTAENFVSRLHALQNTNDKKSLKKGGRPKKKESLPVIEEKIPVAEPIPGPDGLYWCQKCHRHFKKSRQLSRHVCLEISAENDSSSESIVDSDPTSDFRTYMDVEPLPWLRRPKYKCKTVESNDLSTTDERCLLVPEEQLDKTKIYWRDDPNYIHLFESENDRIAFERHLKSIDYSCVDSLFVKANKKTKGSRKKNVLSNISIYSCILCRKEMNSLTHIRMHCLTHTDVKPFTCPKCSYCSNTKGSLYTHMRTHTGKLFKCSICDFKSIKRAHLLEHEQIHSSIPQMCKLCKNSYKTLRSLIGHIRKYHNNPGGKRYAKSLSGKPSKISYIKCDICQKRFKSQKTFAAHSHSLVSPSAPIQSANENIETISLKNVPLAQPQLLSMEDSNERYSSDMLVMKDPLTEMVLNDLLRQKNAGSIDMYENVFQQCSESNLIAATESLSNDFAIGPSSGTLQPLDISNEFQSSKPDLEDCEKTLSLDILNECLRNSDFADKVIRESCGQTPELRNDCGSFGLQMQLAYSNDSLISSNISENNDLSKDLSPLVAELDDKNYSNEPKSAETKLFEKCRRAPAYVCCVCSGIFICPSTLKAHLKEHVNTGNSLIEQADEEFEQPKEAETEIDNVCKMLQEPSESCSDDERELEKLYTSSLDMIWYLPEVSVVLENDPALFDTMLDDISIPMSDKEDESEDLEVKCSDMF